MMAEEGGGGGGYDGYNFDDDGLPVHEGDLDEQYTIVQVPSHPIIRTTF